MHTRIATLLLGFLALTVHAAGQTVTAANPASLVSALKAAGFGATLGVATTGNPQIHVTSGTNAYTLDLMDCVNHVRCVEIVYSARWSSVKNITPAQINARWSQRYNTNVVVFVDTDGALAAVTTMFTEPGGIPAGVFISNLRGWMSSTDNAYTHIVQGK